MQVLVKGAIKKNQVSGNMKLEEFMDIGLDQKVDYLENLSMNIKGNVQKENR